MRKSENLILELFGNYSLSTAMNWPKIVKKQWCPFTDHKCFKIRKSQPKMSIGTCAVKYGESGQGIIICPNRLLERKQVFTDCIHLLSLHEPGNELHVIPEISLPGGSVDYFLVSTKRGKVRDFVAIELQTLDTTGTVWPERQRLLRELKIAAAVSDTNSKKSFGMNWRMTAKTTLVQMHHKVETLEHLSKRIVLVIQDQLLNYLNREFNFEHLTDSRLSDSMHVHSYKLVESGVGLKIELDRRLSTDAAGVAQCLGIQGETKVEIEKIVAQLERKMSAATLFTLDTKRLPTQ
jgi:Restriction endonuclease NotI